MKLSRLERTLAALTANSSARRALEALREGSKAAWPEHELTIAATTLAGRLHKITPAADPEDIGKPWI